MANHIGRFDIASIVVRTGYIEVDATVSRMFVDAYKDVRVQFIPEYNSYLIEGTHENGVHEYICSNIIITSPIKYK